MPPIPQQRDHVFHIDHKTNPYIVGTLDSSCSQVSTNNIISNSFEMKINLRPLLHISISFEMQLNLGPLFHISISFEMQLSLGPLFHGKLTQFQ